MFTVWNLSGVSMSVAWYIEPVYIYSILAFFFKKPLFVQNIVNVAMLFVASKYSQSICICMLAKKRHETKFKCTHFIPSLWYCFWASYTRLFIPSNCHFFFSAFFTSPRDAFRIFCKIDVLVFCVFFSFLRFFCHLVHCPNALVQFMSLSNEKTDATTNQRSNKFFLASFALLKICFLLLYS